MSDWTDRDTRMMQLVMADMEACGFDAAEYRMPSQIVWIPTDAGTTAFVPKAEYDRVCSDLKYSDAARKYLRCWLKRIQWVALIEALVICALACLWRLMYA